jgi:hypothetical protein
VEVPRGQGLRSTISRLTLVEQSLVKAFFALAPSTETSFANPEHEVASFALWLARKDSLSLT